MLSLQGFLLDDSLESSGTWSVDILECGWTNISTVILSEAL